MLRFTVNNFSLDVLWPKTSKEIKTVDLRSDVLISAVDTVYIFCAQVDVCLPVQCHLSEPPARHTPCPPSLLYIMVLMRFA